MGTISSVGNTSDFELTPGSPYLAFADKLWVVYCKKLHKSDCVITWLHCTSLINSAAWKDLSIIGDDSMIQKVVIDVVQLKEASELLIHTPLGNMAAISQMILHFHEWKILYFDWNFPLFPRVQLTKTQALV